MTMARSIRFAALACALASGGCDDTSSPAPTASPADGSSVASTCAPATGPGTVHDSSPDSDETWTAAASPHLVTAPLAVRAGRTLEIEPCAVVRLEADVGILVEGSLLALGAADKPIRIERAGDGAWTSIETRKGASLRMAYATLEGGGSAGGGRPTQFGAIDVRGDQESAPQPIFFADHVTVKGSASLGVWMREGGAFAPGSRDLVITGGATFPILVWGRAAGTLPTGSYTGNAIDEIFLPAMGGRDDVAEDTTLFRRGVPYRVGGETGGSTFTVGAKGSAPLLTIEPGVTLRFAKGTRLLVTGDSDRGGALRAEGTPEAPIVFTSAEEPPAAGDWPGILVAGTADPRDRIAHATIAYAGGSTGVSSYGCPSPLASSFANEGAVVLYGAQPGSAFVTDTRIEDSAADGIVRGWTGADLDFLPTNTLTNVARCKQTAPKPMSGSCPTDCPR